MSKKQEGLLPKFEILIIVVFAISFITWAVPKCNSSSAELPIAKTAENNQEEIASQTTEGTAIALSVDTLKKVSPSPKLKTNAPNLNRLYITINDLKMRTKPNLKGDLVAKLPLFEEVYFLNEVTDSTYEINLGYETANEPWVKIMTKKGEKGWVYGAGVHYHKKKRSGVLE